MIIGELSCGTSCEKRYYLQKNLYDILGKKYKKFYFINNHNIFNKKKLKINYNFYKKKNIIHFNPKSVSELNEFLNKNDIFLINNVSFQFKHIFLSYNNEGLMSQETVKEVMQKYGHYDLVFKEHSRFRSDKEERRNHKANKTFEYMHILEKN